MKKKISIEDIKHNPDDPRRKRKPGFTKRLKDSIKNEGLLQPLIINNDMTLVDGHYRLQALQELGIEELIYDDETRYATLPRDSDFDTGIDSMAANTIRDPETPLEKVIFLQQQIQTKILDNLRQSSGPKEFDPKGYLKHCKHAYTQEGRSLREEFEPWEEERIRILNAANVTLARAPAILSMLDWPEFLKDAVDDGDIEISYAEELAKLDDEMVQKKLLEAVQERDFKVGETRKWVKIIRETPEAEQLLDEVIEKEIDKEGRKAAVEIYTQSVERGHRLSEEETTELVAFVEESRDTIDEWTELRVEQATDALVEGKIERGVEFIPDADHRMLERFNDMKKDIYGINADHILHFKASKAKNRAVDLLWDIHNHVRKQLRDLNEIGSDSQGEYIKIERGE